MDTSNVLCAVQATAQAEHSRTQELYVADLDMTIDTGDESYADRPATTMRVPHPSELRHERSQNGAKEDTSLVRSNKALQVHPRLSSQLQLCDGPEGALRVTALAQLLCSSCKENLDQ